jgi:hypothetical protein
MMTMPSARIAGKSTQNKPKLTSLWRPSGLSARKTCTDEPSGLLGLGTPQNTMGEKKNQRTSSPLHEDNRYFGSGKHGFWPRLEYAIASSVLARHDNGKLYLSISQLSSVAAGAFVARLWLPPSQSSARDAAASFGITMGSNAAFSVVKALLPDLFRQTAHKKPAKTKDSSNNGKPFMQVISFLGQ